MDWFGRADIAFTHATQPLKLTTKEGSEIDLARICKDSTPACQLNPLLFNGHLQTMWTAAAPGAPNIYYRRRIFEGEQKAYGGSFAVDFAVDPYDDEDPALPPRTNYFSEDEFSEIGSDDNRPMLFVLHGLSGGSHEVYLRHSIAPLLRGDHGWAVVVVNARGCANSSITSGVLFNARATWDIRQVVQWAHKTFPNRPLFGLGFSLGANIMTNYVGEEGSKCLLKAAVVVGNPFDLQVTNKALQRTFLGRNVYETVMGENMKKLFLFHKETLLQQENLDFDRIMKVRTLYEFDREVQCPIWGYPTEDAYYRDASSSDSVLAIRIPFFAVQAMDDPIAVVDAVPFGEFKLNPYTVLCLTSLGGHLAWFEPRGGRWHAKPVSNFLEKMATEFDLASIPNIEEACVAHHGAVYDPLRRKMQFVP